LDLIAMIRNIPYLSALRDSLEQEYARCHIRSTQLPFCAIVRTSDHLRGQKRERGLLYEVS